MCLTLSRFLWHPFARSLKTQGVRTVPFFSGKSWHSKARHYLYKAKDCKWPACQSSKIWPCDCYQSLFVLKGSVHSYTSVVSDQATSSPFFLLISFFSQLSVAVRPSNFQKLCIFFSQSPYLANQTSFRFWVVATQFRPDSH